MAVSTNGGMTFSAPSTSLTGDWGGGVTPGTRKHVVWNAGADLPALYLPNVKVRITADDGGPPPAPLSGQVVFVSQRDGNMEIYSVALDGTNLRNLTKNPHKDWLPAQDCGTGRIAFVSDRDGGNEIYTMASDGSALQQLTHNTANNLSPVWSPDGTKLAFVSDRTGYAEIYVINADGTQETRLTFSSSEESQPSWSPDGKALLFVSKRDGNYEVYWMNSDGSGQRNLTLNSANDQIPAFSPDGSQITFVSDRSGDFELWIMEANGTGLRQLTSAPTGHTGQVGWYSWSPLGHILAFDSMMDGDYEVYTINPDGTNLRQLTANTVADTFASWSCDGSKVIFLSDRDGYTQVYAMGPDGINPVNLSNSQSSEALPPASPIYQSGGGCFIATAAYGTPMAPQIQILRSFRDHYLLRSRLGRAFVSLYYRYSPPIAAVIALHPWLRASVRCALAPLVCGLAHPVIGVSFVAVAIALLGLLMRRRVLRHLTTLSVSSFVGGPLRWLRTHREGLARIMIVLTLGLGLCPVAEAATGFGDSPVFSVDLVGLTSGLSVSGTVMDVNGRVVSGASVQAVKTGTLAAESATGPDGRYQLAPLGSGVYALAVSALGFVTDHRVVSLVPATAEQDFTLKPPVAPPTLVSADPQQPLPPSLAPAPPDISSRIMLFDGQQWSTTLKVQTDLATVVLTHGWTPCSDDTADWKSNGINSWPLDTARALTRAGVQKKANILGWDWYEASRPCTAGTLTPPPEGQTPDQGLFLGQALYNTLGPTYKQPIHFLGHSLGTLVNSYAVDYLHGYTRSASPVAEPSWKGQEMQVTLFDDAAIARVLNIESLVQAAAEGAAEGVVSDRQLATAVQDALLKSISALSEWKDPIPHDFKQTVQTDLVWLENYISCAGRYHAEGLNIFLQRSMWDRILADPKYLAAYPAFLVEDYFWSIAKDAHGDPMIWYTNTIPNVNELPPKRFGWGYSLEWSLLRPDQYTFPPSSDPSAEPGMIWWQKFGTDETALEQTQPLFAEVPPIVVDLIPGLVASAAIAQATADAAASLASWLDNTVDWVGTQFQAGAAWSAGPARTVGDVTVQMVDGVSANLAQDVNWAEQQAQEGVNTLLDLFPHQNISATLTTSPPGQPGPLHRTPLVAQSPTGNTPAYLWLPIIVPAQAQWMAFDFAISGDGQKDAMVFGVNGTNLFTLAAQFIPRTEAQTSSPIDVTAYAGKTNELFFGVVGGTSTNCTITIQNIRFYSWQRPRLEIVQAGHTMVLSWPTIAGGYILETTGSLKASWQATTNAPAIAADRYKVTTASTEQTRFFRLRRR